MATNPNNNNDPMAPNPIASTSSSSFLHPNPGAAPIVPDPMILSSSGPEAPQQQGVAVPNPILEQGQQQQQAAAEANNKRTALAGQWRTPPTPFFPSNETEDVAPTPVAVAPAIAPPPPATTNTTATAAQLPNSAEDYAKALQEAYRRGAEAAALAAQQRVATVASCPELVQPGVPAPPQVTQQVLAPVPNPAPSSSTTTMMGISSSTDVPMTNASTAAAATAQQQQPQPPKKSASLPDMASYAAAAEDEKRKKRLARNRASARLRRLRKKNLVDAYETEVGVLETALGNLDRHAWGTGLSTSALVASLSMDRGQQPLAAKERCAAATELLEQQLRYLDFLQGMLEEQRVLQQVAAGSFPDADQLDLQLTPEQCQQILANANGFEDEWNALQTVKSSLQAMKENEWLWNEGCGAVSEQFMAVLHKNQVAKFLQWCDHNAEAIEELDAVHAVHTVADSPVFSFGMDSNPNELMED